MQCSGLEYTADLAGYDSVRWTPLLLAGLLALLGTGVLAHTLFTSAAAQRRQLAVLKCLGFDRDGVGAAVRWHAIAVVGVCLGIAVPWDSPWVERCGRRSPRVSGWPMTRSRRPWSVVGRCRRGSRHRHRYRHRPWAPRGCRASRDRPEERVMAAVLYRASAELRRSVRGAAVIALLIALLGGVVLASIAGGAPHGVRLSADARCDGITRDSSFRRPGRRVLTRRPSTSRGRPSRRAQARRDRRTELPPARRVADRRARPAAVGLRGDRDDARHRRRGRGLRAPPARRHRGTAPVARDHRRGRSSAGRWPSGPDSVSGSARHRPRARRAGLPGRKRRPATERRCASRSSGSVPSPTKSSPSAPRTKAARSWCHRPSPSCRTRADWSFEGAFVDLDEATDLPASIEAISTLGVAADAGTGGPVFISDETAQAGDVQDGMRPLAVALAAVAAAVGVVALVIIGQALARHTRPSAGDLVAMRAVGFGVGQRTAVPLVRALAIGVVGAAGAGVVAIALSPMFPIGPARVAESHSGLHIDVPVLILGTLLVVLLTVVALAPAAAFRARRDKRRPPALGRLATSAAGSGPASRRGGPRRPFGVRGRTRRVAAGPQRGRSSPCWRWRLCSAPLPSPTASRRSWTSPPGTARTGTCSSTPASAPSPVASARRPVGGRSPRRRTGDRQLRRAVGGGRAGPGCRTRQPRRVGRDHPRRRRGRR